jgi:hypothetical protein
MLALGIIISSLLLLGFTRFGIRAVRTAGGRSRVILRAGFLRIDLLKQISKAKRKKEARKREKKPKESKLPMNTLLRAAGPVLRSLRKGIRVDRFILSLTVAGGDDPCDAAMMYGRLCAAWGILRPVIAENLRVRKERVDIRLDFELEKTRWEGEIALTISLGRSLAVLLSGVLAAIKPISKKPRKAVQN